MTTASSDLGDHWVRARIDEHSSRAAALLGAFVVSLFVRKAGSYYTPIDGWGVDLFELSWGPFASVATSSDPGARARRGHGHSPCSRSRPYLVGTGRRRLDHRVARGRNAVRRRRSPTGSMLCFFPFSMSPS